MEAEVEDIGYQAVKRMADKSSNDKHYQAIKESSHFWLERETGQGITALSCFWILSRNIQRFFTAKISASQSPPRQLFPREWQAF